MDRDRRQRRVTVYWLVPLMLFVSSVLMALAWLGHLKFKYLPLWLLVLVSWLIVLPEYVLNVLAIRYGHGTFSGAAMATFNLCTGVVCVALTSAFYLGEHLATHQILGFVALTIAMGMVGHSGKDVESETMTSKEKAPPQLAIQESIGCGELEIDPTQPRGQTDG